MLTFVPISILIVMFPGPDTLVVLRSLIRRGRRDAGLTALGVVCGLCIWATFAALGLSALLKASETGYTVLRIVGACYLVYLGIQSLRSRLSPLEAEAPSSPRRGLLGGGFTAGITTNLLNPKVGVFFVSFLPGFIPDKASVATFSIVLGVIYAALTGIYFLLFLRIADRVTGWMQNDRIRRRMDRITGCVLIGFGVRLATE